MTHLFLPQTRRRLLRGAAQAAALTPFFHAIARAQGDAAAAATARLQEDIVAAALAGRACVLPRGVTSVYRLLLPEGAHLVGAPGGSTLRLAGDGPMIANRAAVDFVTLENIVFDGAGRKLSDAFGLLTFSDVGRVTMETCTVRNSGHGLLQRRCGGKIRLCDFHDLADTAIFNDHCRGFVIDANRIARCGNNGVHHWAGKGFAHDGARISNNVITDIDNRSGGEGLWGNGVRVAETGPVVIENNVIERCSYTAVRNTGGWGVVVAENRCRTFREKAMYAEFGFRDATFRNNVIHDCGAGISATNYAGPGDGDRALILGNVVTGVKEAHPDGDFGPRMGWLCGIEGEGDAHIEGNVVKGSPWMGVLAGFFDARHNVTVEGNSLIDNQYGIGFANQDGVGPCVIRRNDIRGSKKGAIVAMFQERVISGDVSAPGAAKAYKNLVISDNRIS
jgi:uncharacterized secreted repeat protein (TIGR03808 family)